MDQTRSTNPKLTMWLKRAAALIVLATSIVLSNGGTAPQKESPVSTPAVLTAEQDHQRMMELLQIKSLRPGANPNIEGQWIDQRAMFMAAVAAAPVYRLLGRRDLGTNIFPPIETSLIDGDIAWRQHSGGHTTGPNWPTFIDFASRYFEKR